MIDFNFLFPKAQQFIYAKEQNDPNTEFIQISFTLLQAPFNTYLKYKMLATIVLF